jgi:Fe-Mn family superoxide dismutase
MLGDKDLPPYVYGDLKREELVRTGSVVLHDHYFANLGGDGRPGGDVLNAITQAFVSYDQWEAEFKHAYHMDYGAAAGKYVDAFMQNVNWEEVNRRYMNAQKAAPALKA